MVSYNGIMKTFECECHWCGKPLVRQKQAVKVRYHFCNRKCKGEYQRTQKPVTEEWLRQKYLVDGLDCVQIAHLVKRDPKSVWNWMKDFGIPTRPRGQAGNGKGNAWHPSKGTPNPFLGKKHTPETMAKLCGRKHTAETKAKLSAIAKADGRVPFDRKVGPNGGRRGKDHPCWKGGITPERQACYATPEWKRAERAVKKRDNLTCQRCGKVKKRGDGIAFDIHHIVPFECVPLRVVVSNLVYLCEKCHYWVHGKENVNLDFIKEM